MDFISRQPSPTQKKELSLKKSKSLEYKAGNKLSDKAMSNVWDMIEKDPKIARQYVNSAKTKKPARETPVNDKISLKKKELQKIEQKKETLFKLLEDLQRESVNLKKVKAVPAKSKPVKTAVKQKKTKKITKVPQVLPVIPKNTDAGPTKITDYIASISPVPQNHKAESNSLETFTQIIKEETEKKVSENEMERPSINIGGCNQEPSLKKSSVPLIAAKSRSNTIDERVPIISPVPNQVFKNMFSGDSSVKGEILKELKSKIPRKTTLSSESNPMNNVAARKASIFDSADPCITEFAANTQKSSRLTRQFLNCITQDEISLTDQGNIVHYGSRYAELIQARKQNI
ncbi:hypothetical protein HDV01_003851 [Terramyces sp. JEL0728]|nr:hypothetical protein HDV01_003851 [Terramyces sp. JEL0728]